MIKIKITSDRFAEATSVVEYLSLTAKNRNLAVRLIPRFVLDDNDEYIVKVNLDQDGDIQSFDNMAEALGKLTAVTPKRLEKLIDELMEAAVNVVNPTNGRD